MKKLLTTPVLVLILALTLSACSGLSAMAAAPIAPASSADQAATTLPQPTALPSGQAIVPNSFLAAYEGTLQTIYAQVSPSVVSIHVVVQTTASGTNPFGRRTQGPQVSEGLGSGFVWDTQGNIVTNNHVVSGATSIDVTFSDGTNVPAKVVGADPYSDLAVIKVDVAASLLRPVTLADSRQAKVGEVAVAIGNPYGLQNTLTVGVISALGRSLPASGTSGSSSTTGTYTIPDVIQTDAPINPGNSGGVLLDDQGQVLGVTAAIESSSGSNAGIGFVIPSSIVGRVAPALIQSGSYQHPYLGISGTSLTTATASAMNLNAGQRGALVQSVTSGGPAEKAGLKGSTQQTTINGQATTVGGDVITAINGQAVKGMDDLIAYLENNVSVGQKVTLSVLRDGKQISIDLTAGARPSQPLALTNGIPQDSTTSGVSQPDWQPSLLLGL